jgi:hypothetical protein
MANKLRLNQVSSRCIPEETTASCRSFSSKPCYGTKNNQLKKSISRNKSNGSELPSLSGMRICSDPPEGQPPFGKFGLKTPPSGLVLSAERYAAQKQSSAVGPVGTVQREPKTMKMGSSIGSYSKAEEFQERRFKGEKFLNKHISFPSDVIFR